MRLSTDTDQTFALNLRSRRASLRELRVLELPRGEVRLEGYAEQIEVYLVIISLSGCMYQYYALVGIHDVDERFEFGSLMKPSCHCDHYTQLE